MIIKIKRRDDPEKEPYWQSFAWEGSPDATVTTVLDELNFKDDLSDTEDRPARRILWECSCQEKKCGACAMKINGEPALACGTFMRDIKGPVLTLEPLSKFPVIRDLLVDRSIIDENLVRSGMYLKENAKVRPEEYERQYVIAKCLKCGLCLEVCPNYSKGENFFGAAFANEAYLTVSQSGENSDKEAVKSYKKHFERGCSKALSCQDVCPEGLPTLSSMARLNRKNK
ncbi:MAG: succinate dehydrogenase/fumarate reductase iron-sulfur subunit [Parasporobacterium sp.]|nr:succinate dehydrogenase/fumarate reductase iron-sulfur subunit [Parasporobacterium sp.]